MTAHAHPMVSKSDIASLNERYAPWRIEKAHAARPSGEHVTGSFVTQARNTSTDEIIYTCEGWSKASRGQALNAILERVQSVRAKCQPPTTPDNVSDRMEIARMIEEATGDDYVTTSEAAAVVAWCRSWVADCEWLDYDEDSYFSVSALLAGCHRHINGGLAFVLQDVRYIAGNAPRSEDRAAIEWNAIHGTDDEQAREQFETGRDDPHYPASDACNTATTLYGAPRFGWVS